MGNETNGESLRHATAFAKRPAFACANALGKQIVAVILHGSLTLGDFIPGHSDVDLLVIVEQALADEEIDALWKAIESVHADAPSRVDLRVVTREVAFSPTPAPSMEVSLAFGPDRPLTFEKHVAGEPDLVIEFSMVRAHGRSLVGADPSALIGSVPDEWVVAVGDQQLAAWQRLTDDATHAALMVLTACRIWRFSADGCHSSKSEAGRWALARDSSLTAVAEALRQRGGDSEATIGEAGIRRLISVVRGEIAKR